MTSCNPRRVMFVVALLVLPVAAFATPYWGETEIAAWEAGEEQLSLRPELEIPISADGWATTRDEPDYLAVFGLVAAFLDVWQYDRPGNPNHGGMREGEHLQDIIQTDNTSESIWVWSRYYELTGDNQYYQNIIDAFGYSLLNPAYLEEGTSDPVEGYYRMYNCGWATRAELKYRQVYGDDTYKSYGDSCASYIRHHTLVRPELGFYHFVNPHVLSWALGNLYFVGVHGNNAEWRETAVAEARDKVMAWVEEDPDILRNETWAMSGGATMWGMLTSYFVAHPESVDIWVPQYKDSMEVFSGIGQFQNAWNGWYALGHRGVGEILGDAYHLGIHLALTDTLIAEDGDQDGGVPARPEDDDDEDQTWISNYLAFMGLSPLLPPAARVPAIRPSDWAGGLRLAAGPNPARSALQLSYELLQPGNVSLAIYDCTGRRVALLAEGRRTAGMHALTWCGEDMQNRSVASGTYYAILRTHAAEADTRILWLR